MELAQYYVPESILLYLLAEYPLLCVSQSDIVTIFLYDTMSVPFSCPVPEIVTEHRTDYCEHHSTDDMRLSPESSYEDHHIHPRYQSSDDRE